MSCKKVCSETNSIIPNYAQWNLLNISRLFDSCQNWNYDFTIASKYNFVKLQWESSGKKLDKIIWKSSSYPLLNDVLTICGIWSTSYPFTVKNRLIYCLSSSNQYDVNRTNYVGYQYRENFLINKYSNVGLGFYFCQNDKMNIKSLKLGTLEDAHKNCDHIMTPDICSENQLSLLLANLPRANFTYLGPNKIWTGRGDTMRPIFAMIFNGFRLMI